MQIVPKLCMKSSDIDQKQCQSALKLCMKPKNIDRAVRINCKYICFMFHQKYLRSNISLRTQG